MKIAKNTLLLYFVISLLYACKGVESGNVAVRKLQIDPELIESHVRLSDMAETSLIPLPASDTVLVGEINHIYTVGEYIYVSDMSTVFKFSSDGKFVSSIHRRGEAPDEYLNISDFQVTSDDDVWILCRNTHMLYLYSWDNKLKRKLPVDLWVENIRLSGDNSMWLYTGNEKSDDQYTQLHSLDLQSGNVTAHFKPINEHQAQYLFVKGANMFSKGEGDMDCHFFQLFNDTVYRLTPRAITPEYVLEWNGKNIPASFYEKNYENIMDFFQHLHSNGSYAYGIQSFTESESAFGITYYYQGQCYCSIVPKDGASPPVTFSKIFVAGLSGEHEVELSEASVFSQDNGSLVISMDLPDVAGQSEQADDPNPVLLVVKLP